MKNRLKIAVWLLCALCIPYIGKAQQATGEEDRAFWVETLIRIADPVLINLSNGTLKQNTPYESLGNRHRFRIWRQSAVWCVALRLGWNWDRIIRRRDSFGRSILI